VTRAGGFHLALSSVGNQRWICELLKVDTNVRTLVVFVLKRPEWKGRVKLFEIYFLGGVEYRRAIPLVGVLEGTFDYWLQEVKKAASREYSRTGLYPPSHYFQSTHANLSAAARRGIDSVRRIPGSNVAA
jgi:hypothetical protein